jgi:predicted nucleic-acid-binding Zn-ribbon protein
MKNGICPKCQSDEVYVDSGTRQGITPLQNFVVNPPHLYVCADCGYLEFYVQTGFDLSKVKEKFRKVKS